MARKLDRILVIDVEATCWSGAPPEGQESEVIEIGLCTLDVASGERLEKRSLLVKPERSKISEFCTQLTSLTPKQIHKEGISFHKACTLLETEYLSKKRVWASYGDYDRTLFLRQCAACGVDYPFSGAHINVKSLYGIMQALPYEIGMTRAMELCGLEIEGRHHRGVDDAWNIAALLSRLILQRSGEPLEL
ncbi:MAG: exonuclease domain-containing protein [Anaerolineae bacterium]|nr:exonuclease domain-containing protein [Anaerolineae bacterium]